MAVNNQNQKPQTFEIEKPYVIVCEGNDDRLFLSCYLHFFLKLRPKSERMFR